MNFVPAKFDIDYVTRKTFAENPPIKVHPKIIAYDQ